MKIPAFCFFVCLICQEATGQNWFNPGKTWYYNVTTGFDINNYGIHRQTVEGDTVIQGKACKILKYYPKTSPAFVDFLHQDGRKVYHFDDYRKEFELLYDFSLKAGDTLRHRTRYGTVLSAEPVLIGDSTCASMIVEYKTQWATYYMHYAEGIGIYPDTTSALFYNCGQLIHTPGCQGAVDGWDYFVLCIQDGDYTFALPDCVEVLNNTHTTQKQKWTFYPNPAGPEITIQADDESAYLISTTTGVILMQGIKPGKAVVSGLRPGIYMICRDNVRLSGDCRIMVVE